jgi:hypothetical protein
MKKEFFANKALVLSLSSSIAIAATEVPLWISGFSLMIILWKYANEKFNVPKLSTKVTPIMGALIFLIVYLQYKTILGQEESTTILLGLVSLTILNYETERDTLFLVLLGFLIVVIKSVFSLDFIWTIPAIISFFGLWYSLMTNSKVNKIKFLFQTTLKALPMLILLFIFFPRLVIFQSKQAHQVIAQSGFNEDLNPGRFSEVALQNQTVFRADFKNTRMNTEELYWRGAVLNISNGFAWQKGSNEKVLIPTKETLNSAIEYNVILEPLSVRNIFVLDSPIKIISASAPINQLQNRSYALSNLQIQQVQFEAQSAFNLSEPSVDDPTESQKYLLFPDLPPKTKALIEVIKSKNPSLKGRIEALKKFFAQKGFIYTLKPELYQNNLDEFLFERKKGFCEHFAAAFGTLSRALDVPARIVIGYQGGLYNSMGHFWKISQKDAHAWVEIGLDGRWVRVDPTGLVTPLRLTLGGETYFSLSEDEQILNSKNPGFKRQDSFEGSMIQVQLFFENLNYYWTVFLLNYDLQTQLNFLKQFQGHWLVSVVFILLFVLFLIYGRKKQKNQFVNQHELSSLIARIETWALKKGLHFTENQTPLEVLELIVKKYPESASTLTEISKQYESLVYRDRQLSESPQKLKRRWIELSRKLN